jgi:hypothetical protein
VNERDIDAFFQLWACGKPIWEVRQPLRSRAEGLEAIIAFSIQEPFKGEAFPVSP